MLQRAAKKRARLRGAKIDGIIFLYHEAEPKTAVPGTERMVSSMKMTPELTSRIDAWVDAHQEEYLADLAKLIAHPSRAPGGHYEGAHPFGDECAAALDEAAEIAKGYGFSTEIRDYYCLVLGLGEGEEKVGILGHLDIVPASGEWHYPPFQLTRREDGLLIGRGVLDDKGPLWASVFAARCLKELGLLPKRRLEFFCGSDEECGMEDLVYYKKTSEQLPVVAFTPDGSYPICHGEKGIMDFTLDIPVEGSNIVDFVGGAAHNIVPDHAELVLSGVRAEDVAKCFAGSQWVTVAQEGENVRITSSGIAMHASTPEGGVSAIKNIADGLRGSSVLNAAAEKAVAYVSQCLADYYGASIGVPYEDEPSGKLTHVAGMIDMADGVIHLHINIRYPVTCDGTKISGEIRGLAATYGAGFSALRDSKPIYIPAESDLVHLCMETIDSVFHRDWQPYTMGGGTYARLMTNAYALGPEDPGFESPFGIGGGGAHQPDECVSLELMLNTAKVYARLFLGLDELTF